jgi:membrane protease subunit HflK
MAWDDGDKNNPWRDREKGPADLDAVVRDLQRKLAGLFGGGGRDDGGRGPSVSAGVALSALLLIAAVWGLTGFYTVDAAERGVVLRFGEFHRETMPGLRWRVPWPVDTVVKINTGATERWPYQGSMLTRDENIVIVDLVVQYRRTDPQAFLFNMRDPEGTLNDVTASAIREVVGRNDLDFILTEGRAEIAERAHELLQTTLDAYGAGITVQEVNLQEANFPREVEVAVQDAIKAREDRERSILQAQAYSNHILPEARGEAARRLQDAEAYREQKILNAEGEADRFVQVLREYEKAPRVTRERLYLETLEQILSTSTKVLVDTDGGNLLYLPLDQLTRQGAAPVTAPVTTAPTALPSSTPARSRERDQR